MWSPVEKTALAEAEVEYYDKKDTAIYVRFPRGGRRLGASVVIWTTTPWTIPGNRGLAAGHELDYVLLRVDAVAEGSLAVPGEKLIVSKDLLENFIAAVGISAHAVLKEFKGAALAGKRFHHPLAQGRCGL